MNAAETITAAIERLEDQRIAAFPGEWTAFHSGVANGDHSYVIAGDEAIIHISANDGDDEEFRAPTAELIATLHRTIDAQLAILRTQPVGRHSQLGLARAILGNVGGV